MRLAVAARSGLTSPCASSRARTSKSPKLSGSTRLPPAISVYLPLRPNDLRFMAARDTLLLRALLRSFELGRSPSTASSSPTSRFPLPELDALAIPSLCPSFFSLYIPSGRLLFFLRVCAADSFHEGEPATRGIAGEKSAGSERRFFVHSMRARWVACAVGREP